MGLGRSAVRAVIWRQQARRFTKRRRGGEEEGEKQGNKEDSLQRYRGTEKEEEKKFS
jgi:hypothetical protein